MPDLSVRGKLSLDGSEWDATMRNAGEKIEAFNANLDGLASAIGAAFSIGAIKQMVESSVELGFQVTNISQRLGISKEAVQSFGYAFKQAGGDASLLATMFDRLATSSENALVAGQAGERLRQVFQDIGVSVEDLQAKSLEENFRQIMEHMSKTAADAKTISEMREIFGRGGSQLIPISREFAGKLEEGKSLAVPDNAIDELHRFGQQLGELGAISKGALATGIAGLHAALSEAGVERILFHAPLAADTATLDARLKAIQETRAAEHAQPVPVVLAKMDGTQMNDYFGFTGGLEEWLKEFSKTPKEHTARIRGHEDSLLRIGNFLGSNTNAINSIGEQIRAIRENTRAVTENTRAKEQGPSMAHSRGVPSS